MTKLYEIFDQTQHPKDVDDLYHIYNQSNCLNSIYWHFYLELVENLNFNLIVECGVGRGRSLISILSLENYFSLKNSRAHRNIYAFDSFEGFPEPSTLDKSSRNSAKGDWSKSPNGTYNYSPALIREVLIKANIDNFENVSFFKGFFKDSIPSVEINSIGILHLDGDLYHSVLDPLNLLWSKIVTGGIVVVDDFILNRNDAHNEDFPGARKAIDVFLENNDSFVMNESLRGTPYLLKIK